MTTGTKRVALALALAVLALGLTTQVADATHAHPQGATPLYMPLVPAYQTCAAPNRRHGPPLGFLSCNPPVQASSFLTVGTFDANGAAANSTGFLKVRVIPHQCCPPQDVDLTGSISDVRCKAGASPCGAANAAGGPDYTGELQMNSTIRITDHNSGPDFNEPATVVDIPFPINMACFGTASTSVGGTCEVSSSAVAVVPEVSEPARAVVEIGQFKVFDGGPDGQVATEGNTLFAIQGLFIP